MGQSTLVYAWDCSIVPCIRIWDSPICVWDCLIRDTVAAGQQQLQYTRMGQSHMHIHPTATVYAYGTVPYAYAWNYRTVPCIYEHGQQQQQLEQQLTINLHVKKYNMQNKIRSQLANYNSYLYGIRCCPICIWASHISICVWDIPYMYGPIYAYGAEHIQASYVSVNSLTLSVMLSSASISASATRI